MLDEFLTAVSTELKQAGCIVEPRLRYPGVQALLYARSPQRVRLGAAKVEDHILFLDWDNALFGRLELLKEAHWRFSSYANQGFKTPHALRLQIPNLAVVAVSEDGFPDDVTAFARTTSLNPWYGGEVRQVILVDLYQKQVASLDPPASSRFPRPGAIALAHASKLIRMVCERAFMEI